MDELRARFAARLRDLGVTAGVGAALPARPGIQMTTVRLTRGTSTRAYRLLYGPGLRGPGLAAAVGGDQEGPGPRRRRLARAGAQCAGLADRSGYRRDPARPGKTELLDLWAAAFPTGLATKLTLARYRGQIGPVGDVHSEDPVFVSGESAAEDLLRPASLTLYVQELDPRLPVVNMWRSDEPANIVVRRKFWQVPHDSDGGLAGCARRRGLWCTPT